ncbi:hypothetical protein [Paenarthrobacter ilicis]|uniref:DUF7455 domain-containing protein n=1 Tax=Paenarthrobacter ilicis TaxID=43665 RepID=UPI003864AF10
MNVVHTNMLDSSYRCDRCNAQAFMMFALTPTERVPDGELFFCRHHGLKHRAALEPLTEFMADESDRLHAAIIDDKHVN